MQLTMVDNNKTTLATEALNVPEFSRNQFECLDTDSGRQEERVDFRTTGLAYCLSEEGLNVVEAPIRIWTVDVSTIGCLVRSYVEIESKRLLLKLFLPQLNETVIEAEIVRSLKDKAKFLNGKEQESHLYGVKFNNMMNLADLKQELPEPRADNSLREKITELEEQGEVPDQPASESPFDARTMTVAALALASLVAIVTSFLM